MKLMYYGDVLSPNIVETPEGYLICKNVPIGRTGDMTYCRGELGMDGPPDEKIIVHRDDGEVFDIATIASFEGKPTTDNHPNEDVTPDNYANYAKGHAQNVRRGTGEDSDKLVADLFITDPTLISEIVNKVRREVSCGYSCDYIPNEDGTFSQRQIRGNHIAVVGTGRAGKSVCIKDSAEALKNTLRKERKPMKKRKTGDSKMSFLSLFARSIRDAKDEGEVAEAIEEAVEILESATDSEATEPGGGLTETEPKETKDEGGVTPELLAAIKAAVAEAFTEQKKATDESTEEEKGKPGETSDCDGDDLIGKLISELKENASIGEDDAAEQEEALTVEPEKMEDDNTELKAASYDAAIAILKSARPAIAKIKDATERKRVADALLKSVRGQITNPMPAIMKSSAGAARKKANDSSESTFDIAAQQAAYDRLNPHIKKKEDK